MKLVSYRSLKNQTRVGLRVSEPSSQHATGTIIDFGQAFEEVKAQGSAPSAPPSSVATSMLSLIENEDQSLPAARAILSAWKEGKISKECTQPESETRLLSPVPTPPSMRDAYAFRQHVEAARRNRGVPMIPEFDEFPVFYFTNHLAVGGPGPVQVRERHLERLDFELEYAAVVGKPGKNLSAAQADEHIFGFCIMNDLSARGLQMQEMKLSLGPAKGKDFSTTLGPYLVPRSELGHKKATSENGERHDLRMQAWVNGKKVSDGNTKDISWTFAQILERVSYGVSIRPGEVIGSGTVGTGCFLELNGSKITNDQWLQPGDEVILEIDELGRLQNTIELEK